MRLGTVWAEPQAPATEGANDAVTVQVRVMGVVVCTPLTELRLDVSVPPAGIVGQLMLSWSWP